MPRIGIDARELRDGIRTGIGRYVFEVLKAASNAGLECHAYVEPRTQLEQRLKSVSLCELNGTWTQWWDQVVLPRRLKRDRISVFLSPYYKAPLRASCPVVITVHDLHFIGYPERSRPIYDRAMVRLAKLYATRAAAIITDSTYSYRTIIQRLGVSPSKIRVIPLAIGDEFKPTRAALTLLERYGVSQPYLLSVSNFLPHKNLRRLVQAYATLEPSLRESYLLVLAGDGPGRAELAQEVIELGLNGRVVMPGWIDRDDLPGLYSSCTVCVLPSLAEGFGLPALEAMACGVPVAASNRTAIPEVVGEAGVLFNPEDVGDIASALRRLLTDPALRAAMAEKGLQRAGQFSPKQTAARVIALLDEVGKAARER
jgi:glycosyltransferase involved in cell wall biosynthesis